MIWTHPAVFLCLIVAMILSYFVARANKRRERSIALLFSDEQLKRVVPSPRVGNKRLAAFFLVVAIVAFTLTLAEPKYGRVKEKKSSLGRDVFVVFDVSESMLAEDSKPNRLTLAKLDVEDLLDVAYGDRIGLVAFAGSPQVEIPLTTDYEFFRELLRNVDSNSVTLSGTALGDAIRLALDRFGDEPGRKKVLILMTDGEDHDSLPIEAARQAASLGVPIIAVAIGNPEGAPIPVFDVNGKKTGYKKYDGRDAISKPDVETLKEIAEISCGRFYQADSSLDFAKIYLEDLELLGRSELTRETRVALKDRYQYFLAVGLIAFVLYYVVPTQRRAKTIAALLLCAAFCAPSSAWASETIPNAKPQRARSAREEIKAYNETLALANEDSEQFEESQKEFADSKNREAARRANFNLGVAAFNRALKTARQLEPGEEEPQIEVSNPPDAESDGAPTESQPESAIDAYEAKRRERAELVDQATKDASLASKRFVASAEKARGASQARGAAEEIVNWKAALQERAAKRELEIRDHELANPADRLDWLAKEIDARLDEAKALAAARPSVGGYQSMAEKRRGVAELTNDVDAVVAGLQNAPNAGLANGQGSPLATLDYESQGAYAQARDAFNAALDAASTGFAQYDAGNAAGALEDAEANLTLVRAIAKPYDQLVIDLANQERETTESLANESQASLEKLADYARSRKELRRILGEVQRKAEIVERNYRELDEAAPDDVPQAGEEDEIEFDSNEVPNVDPSVDYQRKALESARVALAKKEELSQLVDEAGDVDGKPLDELVERQRKISEILDEIAAPFKEDQNQQNNQDQQNSKNQQDDQDQENQQNQQNNQSQQSNQNQQNDQEQQNNQDQQNGSPEENEDLNRPDNSDEDSEEDQNEDANETNQQKTTEEASDVKKPPKSQELEEDEKSADQKEADAFLRIMQRRQMDADPQRRAIRNALKRREKSGKDW